MAIYFYHVEKPYGAFSNFANYGFDCNGRHWPTSEHYFQAQKFAGSIREEDVRQAPSAWLAARMGRDRNFVLRPDWENVKLEVMRTALRLKFSNNLVLVDLLLSTGNEELIEQTTDDYFWGSGSDGRGLNMLGKLLMELREEYRSNKTALGA